MTLPVLFTAASYGAERHYDVALAEEFRGTPQTATLELNPGGQVEPSSAELTPTDARALRDALDALLGERRATIPDGFSGSLPPTSRSPITHAAHCERYAGRTTTGVPSDCTCRP